jgi:hypothetical protein
MSRPRTEPATGEGARAGARAPAALEALLLAILLAIIPLRAVLNETHTFETPAAFRSLDAPGTVMPATTLVLSGVLLACGAAVAAMRLARGSAAWRPTGIEAGGVVLLAGMVASTAFAGHKHLAIVTCVDFAGLVGLAIALRQLLDQPWKLRLALGVVLSAGAMVVVKCLHQRYFEWPATLEYYEQHRGELLSGVGPASAGFIHDYEQRLKSGAVSGYFGHPNVLASYLILVVFSALGVMADCLRRAGDGGTGRAGGQVIPGLVAVGAGVMLAWAQSKGAVLALVVGLLAWVCLGRLRGWIRRRPAAATIGFWIVMLAGAAGLAGLLAVRPHALGLSMFYRSMYWRAAAAMAGEVGLLGVGGGQFGRFFTRYKPVECPEDVEDPHSWVLRAACEWGIIGAAGLFLIFGGISWRLFRPPAEAAPAKAAEAVRPWPVIPVAAGIGAILFGAWLVVLGNAGAGYIVLTLHLPLIAWFVTFIAGSIRRGGDRRLENGRIPAALAGALCAGLVAFLVHSGIDLALFHAGPATTFFALIGCALAGRSMSSPAAATGGETAGGSIIARGNGGRPAAAGCLIAAGAGAIAALGWLAGPAARAGSLLRSARSASSEPTWDAYLGSVNYRDYRAASEACPLDSTALDELIGELTRRVATVKQVDLALALAGELLRRDPHSGLARQHVATLYAQRFELGRQQDAPPVGEKAADGEPGDLDRAIAAMREAVAAYPTSPARRLYLADLLERRAGVTGRAADRLAASEELRAVLDLDAKRVYVSKPHRFGEARRRAIDERIRRLRGP